MHLQSVSWGSVEWVGLVANVRSHHEALLRRLSEQQHCLSPVVYEIQRIFARDMPPKLRRFPVLLKCITAQLLPALTTSVLIAIQPELEFLLRSAVQQLYARDLSVCVAQFPNEFMRGCILSHFIYALQCEAQQPQRLKLPADFKLEETAAFQERRAALHAEIERLELSHRRISNIEDAFSPPESPPAAF